MPVRHFNANTPQEADALARVERRNRFLVPHRADALDHGGLRRGDESLFERDHVQGFHAGEQLVGSQKKIRIARAAIALVAQGESFVDEYAARTHRTDQIRKERSMQIVGHDHAVELAWRKGPGPRLDVRNENLRSAGSTECSERRLIAIDADDGKAQRAQVARVPAVATGDVENAPARP